MVKSTTEHLGLEIEDENEAVDNSYINRNFEKIDARIKLNEPISNTNYGIVDGTFFVQYPNISGPGNVKPRISQILSLYYYLKNKFDLIYDKTTGVITGAITSVLTSNLLANRVTVSDANGKIAASTVTAAELNNLKNTTSNIQTQINSKAQTNHAISSGTYGIGTTGVFGHVKIVNNLTNGGRNNNSLYNGEALASNQGRILNERLKVIEATNRVRSGTAVPDDSLGSDGDLYIRIW